jgi:hypothetical protein
VPDRTDPQALGEFNGFEIYPMPVFATLSVGDVAAVARWYADALGFGTMFTGPAVGGQPSLVHLRRNKYQDLLLVPARPGAAATAPSSLVLSFNADDVDTLAARARRGVGRRVSSGRAGQHAVEHAGSEDHRSRRPSAGVHRQTGQPGSRTDEAAADHVRRGQKAVVVGIVTGAATRRPRSRSAPCRRT